MLCYNWKFLNQGWVVLGGNWTGAAKMPKNVFFLQVVFNFSAVSKNSWRTRKSASFWHKLLTNLWEIVLLNSNTKFLTIFLTISLTKFTLINNFCERSSVSIYQRDGNYRLKSWNIRSFCFFSSNEANWGAHRTALFSIRGAKKRLIEHITSDFHKNVD